MNDPLEEHKDDTPAPPTPKAKDDMDVWFPDADTFAPLPSPPPPPTPLSITTDVDEKFPTPPPPLPTSPTLCMVCNYEFCAKVSGRSVTLQGIVSLKSQSNGTNFLVFH